MPAVPSTVVEGSEATVTREEKIIALADSPEFSDGLPAPLRFRFFQKVEGDFQLPAGMDVEELVVSIEITGKQAQHIEQRYAWRQLIDNAGRKNR